MKNTLVKKFLTFSYGSFLGAIIGFVTTMITTRVLQPEQFGKASMFLLVINISMIFIVFGTDQAFVRFFYEEKEERRGGLLYNCLKMVLVILIPFIVVFILLQEQISNFLFGEYNFPVIIILAIGIVLHVLYRFGQLIIRMRQKGNFYSIINILNRLLVLICVILFYFLFGERFEILVFATVFSCGIITTFLIVTERSFWGLRNINTPKLIHSKREIFKYSYPFVFTMILTWLFESTDKIALRQWADFKELGLYSAAFIIIGLLTIIKSAFTSFWVPIAYETFENDPSNIKFFEKVSKIVSFSMFLIAILVILSKDLIILFLGSQYSEASLMLSFLVFIPVMYTISETTVIGINFYKKVKWHIVISSLSCICNIVGNYLLVPTYGGIGAAISTGTSYIVFFTLRTIISLRYYRVSYALHKVYLSIIITFLYSIYTLTKPNIANHILFGIMALTLLGIVYRKDIITINKIIKEQFTRT